MDDSFANDKSILESLKKKQNLIIISIFKHMRKLNHLLLGVKISFGVKFLSEIGVNPADGVKFSIEVNFFFENGS